MTNSKLLQSQIILKKLKKHKYTIMHINNLEVLTQLTISGLGLGILPERVVSIFNKNKRLKKVKNSPIFIDELCLVYHVETKNLASTQTCIHYIKKAFSIT